MKLPGGLCKMLMDKRQLILRGGGGGGAETGEAT